MVHAKLGHTGARALATRGGAPPVQVSKWIISALLIANQALNSLEIKRRSNPQNYRAALFVPSTSGDWCWSSIFQSPDIVLVPISDHFLCNYRLTLHHVAFENFPHEVDNWVGAFWNKLETFAGNWSNNGGWADIWFRALFRETTVYSWGAYFLWVPTILVLWYSANMIVKHQLDQLTWYLPQKLAKMMFPGLHCTAEHSQLLRSKYCHGTMTIIVPPSNFNDSHMYNTHTHTTTRTYTTRVKLCTERETRTSITVPGNSTYKY